MKQLPKYQLLASKINDDIKNGLYREGDRLASENELNLDFWSKPSDSPASFVSFGERRAYLTAGRGAARW